MPALNLLPTAISELFAQAAQTGKLTLADRYGLLAALLDGSASDEEMQAIDRLFRAVRQGRVQLVDELSVVL